MAHLNLEQAHEYLRHRLAKTNSAQNWTLREIFEVLDIERKGCLSVYDLEKLIVKKRKGGSRNIVEEIEQLIAMFDRKGSGKIKGEDFERFLLPRLEA